MTTKREWAKEAEVKPGHVLISDPGFTCIPPYTRLIVQDNGHGNLFVECEKGRHYLDGQLDEAGNYVGFWKE